MTSYVFNNVEVKPTGREARRMKKDKIIDVLIEITPVDKKEGNWKQWARQTDLYEVINNNENT